MTTGDYIKQIIKQRILINVILLHPKGMNRGTIDQHMVKLSALTNNALADKKDKRVAVVTAAEDDYLSHCKYGKWDKWIESVISRYSVFVCMKTNIGKGTADVVRKALDAKRPVRLMTDKGLVNISSLIEIDSDNWIDGWKVIG